MEIVCNWFGFQLEELTFMNRSEPGNVLQIRFNNPLILTGSNDVLSTSARLNPQEVWN